MSKEPKRWQIWKIAAGTAGCAAGAVVLFLLSTLAERYDGGQSTNPLTRAPALTLSSFIMMLAIGAASLSVLGAIWLVFRIREARMPAWKRRGRKKRR